MRVIKLIFKYIAFLGPGSFTSYLIQRFIKKNKVLLIKVPGLRDKVAVRNKTSDIPLFAHIFILKEYNVPLKGDVKTIIDCGANIGLASLFFLTKYPNARIIAVEPERNNYDILKRNLASYPQVTCINKGVWNKAAVLKVVNEGHGNHAFIVKETTERTNETIEALSVSDILTEYDLSEIDILKVDIEGSEEQLFLSNAEWLNKVRMIFCEIHENMKPGLTEKITSLFNSNYEIFMHGEYHVFKKNVY